MFKHELCLLCVVIVCLIRVSPGRAAVASSASSVTPSCGINEEFSTCGPACEVSCDNPQIDTLCMALCVEGCFCSDGYIRGPDGVCIPPEDCQLWFPVHLAYLGPYLQQSVDCGPIDRKSCQCRLAS